MTLTTWLVHMLHNFGKKKKKIPTSSHCNTLVKLAQEMENLLVLNMITC